MQGRLFASVSRAGWSTAALRPAAAPQLRASAPPLRAFGENAGPLRRQGVLPAAHPPQGRNDRKRRLQRELQRRRESRARKKNVAANNELRHLAMLERTRLATEAKHAPLRPPTEWELEDERERAYVEARPELAEWAKEHGLIVAEKGGGRG